FIGINDQSSWIIGATVPVRRAQTLSGTPSSTIDQFNLARLADSSLQDPDSFMKADPRATRFGIFQFRPPSTSTSTRIKDPLWSNLNPTSTSFPNGYGGTVADPAGPVEHAPLGFAPPKP